MTVHEPGSKLLVLGMVIQPLIGNPYNGYINPYYWVDDHPLLYGNNGGLDPGTHKTYVTGPAHLFFDGIQKRSYFSNPDATVKSFGKPIPK